jgi:hypothetical protein
MALRRLNSTWMAGPTAGGRAARWKPHSRRKEEKETSLPSDTQLYRFVQLSESEIEGIDRKLDPPVRPSIAIDYVLGKGRLLRFTMVILCHRASLQGKPYTAPYVHGNRSKHPLAVR